MEVDGTHERTWVALVDVEATSFTSFSPLLTSMFPSSSCFAYNADLSSSSLSPHTKLKLSSLPAEVDASTRKNLSLI